MKKYVPKAREELKGLVDDLNINLGDIDVSNITDMSCLFYESVRKDFSGIESWNVGNVVDMSFMFAISEFNQDISKWNVSNVEDMALMFYDSKFNKGISKWNVSNVRFMHDIFEGSKFTGDINKWELNKDVEIDESTLKMIYRGRIE